MCSSEMRVTPYEGGGAESLVRTFFLNGDHWRGSSSTKRCSISTSPGAADGSPSSPMAVPSPWDMALDLSESSDISPPVSAPAAELVGAGPVVPEVDGGGGYRIGPGSGSEADITPSSEARAMGQLQGPRQGARFARAQTGAGAGDETKREREKLTSSCRN